MASSEVKAGEFELNFKKLEMLSQQLQNNEVSIDQLIPRMKDALSAIRVCKDVLKATKVQLKEIDSEFEQLAQKSD